MNEEKDLKKSPSLEDYRKLTREYVIFCLNLDKKYGRKINFNNNKDIRSLDNPDWEKIFNLNLQMDRMAMVLNLTSKKRDQIDAQSGIRVTKIEKKGNNLKESIILIIRTFIPFIQIKECNL